MITIATSYTSGKIVYAVIYDAESQPYNFATGQFENFNQSDWPNYALALAEQFPSGYYVGTLPASLIAPPYAVRLYVQAYLVPSILTDTFFNSGNITNEDIASGGGPYVITATIENTNSQPIAGATVAVVGAAGSMTAITDALGVANLSVAAGNWSLSASALGFQSPAPVPLVVSASVAQTITLGQIANTYIAAPSTCWCSGTAYSPAGAPLAGIPVTFSLLTPPPSASAGQIFDASPVVATTNANGEIATSAGNFIGLYQGATYSIAIGNSIVVASYAVPDAAQATLPPLTGTP